MSARGFINQNFTGPASAPGDEPFRQRRCAADEKGRPSGCSALGGEMLILTSGVLTRAQGCLMSMIREIETRRQLD